MTLKDRQEAILRVAAGLGMGGYGLAQLRTIVATQLVEAWKDGAEGRGSAPKPQVPIRVLGEKD